MATETARIADFTLPSLGSDMDEGTVLTWLVAPGDQVHKGDVLLRVDTEKAEIDVEVWHEAVVVELLVQPGQTVPVGTPLARLESASRAPAAPPGDSPSFVDRPDVTTALPRIAPSPAESDSEPLVTEARPTGVSHVTPRMVFWPADHLQQSAAANVVPRNGNAASQTTPSREDRRQSAVATLMERSNRDIPHFHLVRQIDLTAALRWLNERNDTRSPSERILPAALLLYAVAHAGASSPVNGTFDGEPVDAGNVDLGVAVHVRGGGLMTPVLPRADCMALDTLMGELQSLVGRARAGRLSSRDMTPATLTVTNLGDAGGDVVLGVIRPPERALVGFGQIAERAVVVDGEVVARPTVQVTLSADHRVINGQAGSRFLAALNTMLSQPDNFILEGAPS